MKTCYSTLSAIALVAQITAALTTLPSLPTTLQLSLASNQQSNYILQAPPSAVSVTLSLCAPPAPALAALPLAFPNASLFLSTAASESLPGPATSTAADLSAGRVASLVNGFANVTVQLSAGGALYIGVVAPDGPALGLTTAGGLWRFELGVVAAGDGVTIERAAGFKFEDADGSSVLLTTDNFTAPNPSPPPPAPTNLLAVLVPSTPITAALSSSVCYVRSVVNANLVVNQSTTTRGFGGGLRSQFQVNGLSAGVNYTSWLIESAPSRTRLFQPVLFATKNGTSCRLLHSLPFCPLVAYSVPSPLNLPVDSLISYYSNNINASYAVFLRTLTTFPCHNLTYGPYSRIATCSQCAESYLTWLCAVTMPRCTDSPSNATLDATNTSSWPISAKYHSTLLRSNPLLSRTPDFAPSLLSTTFNTTPNLISPFPYSEVPPCLDVCNLVLARCPPFIQWSCPAQNDGGTGSAGYGVTKSIGVDERMAGDPGGGLSQRGADRFGNVFCNSLGTDMLATVQFSRAAFSSSRPSSNYLVVLVPLAVIMFIAA